LLGGEKFDYSRDMIDVYRFILSVCVVQGHLLAWGSPLLAWQAVFSFYVLSGFLMTLILNQDYGFTPMGLWRFALNRFLRLFPIYWLVIGATALYIAWVGPLTDLNGAIALPNGVSEQVANLSIVSLTGFDSAQMAEHRLVPTAWSLSIELFCYAILAVYFAKSWQRLSAMLAAGIVVAATSIIAARAQADYGFLNHYSVLQAGLIPFAIGGLAYFAREARVFAFSQTKLAVIGLLLVANVAAGYVSDFHKYVGALYVGAALNLFLVPMLFQRGGKKEGWTSLLGGMAYPMFVSHWLIGTLTFIQVPAVGRGSLGHFLIAAAGTMLLSASLYHGVDRQVQRLRTLVKSRNFVTGALAQPSSSVVPP
jgi:peptidoglycan/LPS O-acetylase OafA/YrhL